MHSDRNIADAEYVVMLAVLDFQTEFLKSHYNHARVHIHEQRIEVVLTRSSSIPAEEQLAQSPEGRTLLEQVHGALFKTGESLLRDKLEACLGMKTCHIASRLDLRSHTNTIIIQLAEAFQTPSSMGEAASHKPLELYYQTAMRSGASHAPDAP